MITKLRLLVLLVLLCGVNAYPQTAPLNGSGTADDPFLINTIEDLTWMRDRVNNGDATYVSAHYKLMCSLNFAGQDDWVPIGKSEVTPFKGFFDGNGMLLANIHIGTKEKPMGAYYGGFIGYMTNGSVSNLAIIWTGLYTTALFPDSRCYSGGIAGYVESATIHNSYTRGSVTSSDYAGGIAGMMVYSTLSNCESGGDITSATNNDTSCSGGLIGYSGFNKLSNSYSTGTISSLQEAGGIVGYSSYDNIVNCFSTGTLFSTSNSARIGGIAGQVSSSYIINSYSIAFIEASAATSYEYSSSYVGGIAGISYGATITNCYSASSLSSFYYSYAYIGGIVGYTSNSSIVMNCLALNQYITAISNNLSNTFICRIGYDAEKTTKYLSNYANKDMLIKQGANSDNLTYLDLSGEANGEDLTQQPVILLNDWVSSNYSYDIEYKKWSVREGTNNNLPFFADLLYLKVYFYTGTGYSGWEVLYGSLIYPPSNPVRSGYTFEGWYKDAECTQIWNFDTDRVYSDIILYARWGEKAALDGSGTANDPYRITSIEDLLWVRDKVNSATIPYVSAHYKLMSDLDFSKESDWVPIGADSDTPFKGSFDGNGKTIKNLNIGTKSQPVDRSYAGFIGYLENGTVKSLRIEWTGIYTLTSSLGGIVSISENSIITNCSTDGTFSSIASYYGYSRVAGIVGGMEGGKMVDCSSSAKILSSTIDGDSYAGGIIADAEYTEIVNCSYTGSITSISQLNSSMVGGIIGSAEDLRILNCFTTGIVTSSSINSYAGGIAGVLKRCSLVDNYSSAPIYSTVTTLDSEDLSDAHSGGLVGYMEDAAIVNSYFIGQVISETLDEKSVVYSGGIAGYSYTSNISNSYAICSISSSASDVSSSSYSGGIVGVSFRGPIINTYFVGTVSSSSVDASSGSYAGGILGNSSDAMIENCIVFESQIAAINPSLNQCFVGRISGASLPQTSKNYASSDVTISIGTSATQLATITGYSEDKDGDDLKASPLEQLNSYVQNNAFTNAGTLLYSWKVDSDKNQGYPMLDYDSVLISFDLQGAGTSDNPYQIHTNNDLWTAAAYMSSSLDHSNKCYKLMADLDFSNEGNWVSIGNKLPFSGTFDGNNKVIRNIRQGSEDKPVEVALGGGLFGRLQEGRILNLGIEWLGIFVFSNTIDPRVGGIVGSSDYSDILNCYSTGPISFTNNTCATTGAGGIVGGAYYSNISNCYSTSSVFAFNYSGGIVGDGEYGSIINCYSTGDISSAALMEPDGEYDPDFFPHSCSGGIVGNTYKFIIINCYATGAISSAASSTLPYSSSYANSGGIVGDAYDGDITNCYSLGSIYSTSSSAQTSSYSNSGGIVGDNGGGTKITNSLALGQEVVAINQDADNAHVARIANSTSEDIKTNYADKNMVLKKGTSKDNLQTVTPSGDKDGATLTAQPVNLLNAWVNANTGAEKKYLNWVVMQGVNDSYPVFAELWAWTVSYESNGGSMVAASQVKHGLLVTQPLDPILEGYEFVGWHKDADCKQKWDFANDKVYGHTTLYAKWAEGTSIAGVEDDATTIYSTGGKIVVENATSTIQVYDLSGTMIKVVQYPTPIEQIQTTLGIYIVRVGKKSTKIMVY